MSTLAWTLCAAIALLMAQPARASLIFDDFNTNEGHFNQNPTFSGSSNVSTASTADRVTTGDFEGGGAEHVVAVQSTTNPARLRFVSGNAVKVNNVAFTTSAGTDGFIGYYAKTSTTGIKLGMYLDDSTDATAGTVGAIPKSVIADGQYHLYEWDLDNAADWGVISGSGIAGAATVTNDSHTIDSIWIQGIASGADVTFDFVAKSDSGSIAALVPEPASVTVLGGAALLGLVRRRRRVA